MLPSPQADALHRSFALLGGQEIARTAAIVFGKGGPVALPLLLLLYALLFLQCMKTVTGRGSLFCGRQVMSGANEIKGPAASSGGPAVLGR